MSNEKKLPKAMYRGKLPIGNLELDCYVLDDETRILSATSIFTSFGRSRSGLSREKTERVMSILNQNIPNHGWSQIPPFLGSKGIISLINTNDLAVLRPVEFLDGENKIQGYKAELLPRLCSLYLEARRVGTLDKQQTESAKQAEILLSAFANVGIIALIDEATGFQINRKSDALRIILKKHIEEHYRKWDGKQFDDDFFEALDRLYQNEKTTSRARPQYYGKFIVDYIYKPLENGFLKIELDKLNITDDGKRKARFHQWLTKDSGIKLLARQIGRVQQAMDDSDNLEQCKYKLDKQKPLITSELFNDKEIVFKPKNKVYNDDNPTSAQFIKNIEKDNVELNENNEFEKNIKKVINFKK